MVQKAEKNLKEFLEVPNGKDIKVKADITKFVAERLNKEKYGKEDNKTNIEFGVVINLPEQKSEYKEIKQ